MAAAESGETRVLDTVNGVRIEETATNKKRKFSFKKDCAFAIFFYDSLVLPVPPLMFGAGDNSNPYDETIDLLDDIVVEFVANMVVTR